MDPELQAHFTAAETAKAAFVQAQNDVARYQTMLTDAQNAVVSAAQNYESARQQLGAAVTATYPAVS